MTLTGASLLAVSLSTTSTSTNAAGEFAPLKRDERARATDLVRTALKERKLVGADTRFRVVSVQPVKPGKSKARNTRTALVQVYNYDNNQLLSTTVNVRDNRVSRTIVSDNKQPPLANTEREDAVRIALADASTSSLLKRTYTRVTGSKLTRPREQLRIKPRNFRGSDAANDEGSDSGDCQRARCVQLAIATNNSVRLNIVPVVNLSSGTVVTVMRTGASDQAVERRNRRATERRRVRDENRKRRAVIHDQ